MLLCLLELGISIIRVLGDESVLGLAHFVSLLVFSITYVPAEYLEEYKAGLEQTPQGGFSEIAPPPK